jgi:hypothetical protein
MQLPEVGSVVAVQYKRNPRIVSDAMLDPRLFFGRVLAHQGAWGFTAALLNCDSVAQETWLEYDQENGWEDRSFQQPVDEIHTKLGPDTLAIFSEFEQMPAEWPASEDGLRSYSEMRLRFLAGGMESGWLDPGLGANVYYSDDFAAEETRIAHWRCRPIGKFEITEEMVRFEWPIDDKPAEECMVELARREDGAYYAKSEEFGDEFEARLEKRSRYHLLTGLWSSEEFVSFFGAIFPLP